MQPKFLLTALLFILTVTSFSQSTLPAKADTRWLKGMYFQFGYSRFQYSRSTIRFSDGDRYDFTLHNAKAHDQPDFDGVLNSPFEVSIPQYVYRIGFYLNKAKTHAIEINYDHAKYVVNDFQNLHVTGQIFHQAIDKDTTTNPNYFVHMEHTNGANFYHINYVMLNRFGGRRHRTFAFMLKAGAGVVIPKTDVTLFGKELDTKYKIAGYIISVEDCFRVYPLSHWFFEFSGKTGFANYVNANSVANGKVSHHFWYGGITLTTGWDINF